VVPLARAPVLTPHEVRRFLRLVASRAMRRTQRVAIAVLADRGRPQEALRHHHGGAGERGSQHAPWIRKIEAGNGWRHQISQARDLPTLRRLLLELRRRVLIAFWGGPKALARGSPGSNPRWKYACLSRVSGRARTERQSRLCLNIRSLECLTRRQATRPPAARRADLRPAPSPCRLRCAQYRPDI
jgi:hypothetical protein